MDTTEPNIAGKLLKKRAMIWALGIVASSCFTGGCAYRFTNQFVRLPQSVRSIAIEAVYDTSGIPVPHQYLWQALNDAFAQDGHLVVTTPDKADAIVVSHIRTAHVGPSGTVEPNDDADEDPEYDRPAEMISRTGELKEFRRLDVSGQYTQNARIHFSVLVEVYNLTTKQLLLKRAYSGRDTFKTIREEKQYASTLHYLAYHKAVDHGFAKISERIAQKVVQDLLVNF